MSSTNDAIRELAQQEYKWGFVTDIGEDRAPKGLAKKSSASSPRRRTSPNSCWNGG